jgi:hypothetical protein
VELYIDRMKGWLWKGTEWNESAVTYFKPVRQNMHGQSEKSHESLNQYRRFLGRDSNSRRPDYEAGVLTTTPLLSEIVLLDVYWGAGLAILLEWAWDDEWGT